MEFDLKTLLNEIILRYPKGHFWSPGKFARYVSDVDLQTVVDYVGRHSENRGDARGLRVIRGAKPRLL